VTKPGLGLEVGGPAINPVPRQMLNQNVGEAIDLTTRGLVVVLSVPDGEKRAKKTTNARLGILGGISILGTTGVVRPFSTESWRASVLQAVDVMAAQGLPTLVLATGGRTEKAAMRLLPDLPPVCFVEVGDFTGAALKQAVSDGLRDVVFVGMAGKLTKLASGVLMTHYTRSKVDTAVLVDVTAEAGGGPALLEAVRGANTARHAYEMWEAGGLLREAGDLLCARVGAVLTRFCGLPARVAMVDPNGAGVVAATEPHWVRAA
jgi:cobalt-precorrin-5B (C1)-methyltransferase